MDAKKPGTTAAKDRQLTEVSSEDAAKLSEAEAEGGLR